MLNIISVKNAQIMNPVLASMTAQQVSTLIRAATWMVSDHCNGQLFSAERQTAEPYDRIMYRWLSLQRKPLVQLNSVTISPDQNPTVYTASDFDIRVKESRISFKPSTVGAFGGGQWFMESAGAPLNGTLVDYFAGYGFVTTLTAAVTAGSNVTLPLAATSGYINFIGHWQINDGDMLVLDSGLSTSEEVTVAVSSGGVVTATIAQDHASGAYAAGSCASPAVQWATAQVVANILLSPDLTRQMEGLGRIGGYESQMRKLPAGILITPEVSKALGSYTGPWI